MPLHLYRPAPASPSAPVSKPPNPSREVVDAPRSANHAYDRVAVQAVARTGGGGVVQCQNGDGKKPQRTTQERAKRAKLRYDKRRQEGKAERYLPTLLPSADQARTSGTMVPNVDTPFGPVNFSKFPTLDPGAKVTTVQKNYEGASVGHKYSEMQEALAPQGKDEEEVASALLLSLSGKKQKRKAITSPDQRNAAAKLLAISHASEPQRVGGTAKMMRATLRMVGAGQVSMEDAFSGDTPLFPMAKTPTYARRLVNYDGKKLRKPPTPHPRFADLGDYYSDSSDDEVPAQAGIKRKAGSPLVRDAPTKKSNAEEPPPHRYPLRSRKKQKTE